MGNDMFNNEQLAHAEIVQKETEEALGFWKERALKAEADIAALRLALETANARIADLENPNFVDCDGLHADGKYPNTPHRPIGVNRLYPCPACEAERERDEARALIQEKLNEGRCGIGWGERASALLSRPAPPAERPDCRMCLHADSLDANCDCRRHRPDRERLIGLFHAAPPADAALRNPDAAFIDSVPVPEGRILHCPHCDAAVLSCDVPARPADAAPSLDALAIEADNFARTTFPSRSAESISEHLRREAIELAAAPNDAEEMADVFILLGNLVHFTGTDLNAAVVAKLAKNRARKWGKPDAHGVVEHVRETPPAAAATEAVRKAAKRLISVTLESCTGDCAVQEHIAARALRRALSARAPAPLDSRDEPRLPDGRIVSRVVAQIARASASASAPAPAPSAKEGRT